MPKTVWEFS